MKVVDVYYFWEGSVFPNKNLKFTITLNRLRKIIEDMANSYHFPLMEINNYYKREVQPHDLKEKVRWVEISDFSNSRKEIVFVLQSGRRCVIRGKKRKRKVS